MRKYLRKRENGVYYIAEGYNEKQMVADGFSNVTAGISAGRKMIRAMGDNFSEPVYGVKWVDAYAIYAACEKQDEKKLEGYNIVGTPGELIGKGGGLWSRQMKNHLRPFFYYNSFKTRLLRVLSLIIAGSLSAVCRTLICPSLDTIINPQVSNLIDNAALTISSSSGTAR